VPQPVLGECGQVSPLFAQLEDDARIVELLASDGRL
jgi:hypothetical protein